jgi:hypothetical protein
VWGDYDVWSNTFGSHAVMLSNAEMLIMYFSQIPQIPEWFLKCKQVKYSALAHNVPVSKTSEGHQFGESAAMKG